jgi:chaperonin cofactor prefoldin
MVDVVTVEEFKKFRASLEGRLEALEGRLEELLKEMRERYAVKADVEGALTEIRGKLDELNVRIDTVEETSKGFITRLREAMREVFKM